ncbi:MAG: Transglutaminase domain protein [Chthonomonadales bacterium]|nr:Transglutaminase domain protein [Chthonomonadales bacterium]
MLLPKMAHFSAAIFPTFRLPSSALFGLAAALLLAVTGVLPASGAGSGQPKAVEEALTKAGANRAELQIALKSVPAAQREGMQFLIANMPVADLQTLSSKYLLESVGIAYEAYEKAPWKGSIAKDLFLNDILPYSCLNEQRDDSRKMLREKSLPLIADCKTAGEAAQRLNQKLFPLLNARYSTERKRPDQNPTETIASGKATCSGLSILLVDACRAVGIPARVAGTPLWTNLRGNHTWVEVWDGEWHFTGAAEPDPAGLDRGWFVGDASKARKDLPQHAIYASSFKQTGIAFPLVWAPEIGWIPAVNVTDRYTPKTAAVDKPQMLVKVLNKAGKRVAAQVALRELTKSAVTTTLEGTSKDESADLNDMLTFDLLLSCPPPTYRLTVTYAGHTIHQDVKSDMSSQQVVVVTLP